MKFSIIIPAYKSEGFITKCLESLVNQDFPANEFEIIVVDDCSPDNQNEVIDKFIDNLHGDYNITLLKHSENKRQGGARNTGIAAATGEWIMFVDSDDFWVRNDVLKTFDTILQNNDCEIIESKIYVSESNITQSGETNIECLELSPEEYYSSIHHPCIWASVYKKSHIKNIKFRENVSYEDCDWKILAYTSAKKIGVIDFPFYFYSYNPESTTHELKAQTFRDIISTNQFCRQAYDQSPLSETLKNRLTKTGTAFKVLFSLRNYSISDGKLLLNELYRENYLYSVQKYCSSIEKILIRSTLIVPSLFLYSLHGLVKIKRLTKK